MKLRPAEPVPPWHWWFAWHPVRTWSGDWLWMRWIHRTLVERHSHERRGWLQTQWVHVKPFLGKERR